LESSRASVGVSTSGFLQLATGLSGVNSTWHELRDWLRILKDVGDHRDSDISLRIVIVLFDAPNDRPQSRSLIRIQSSVGCDPHDQRPLAIETSGMCPRRMHPYWERCGYS
jgi:hypothetical protein